LSNNPNNIKLKRRWWAFHANRTEFYEELRRHPRCLVNTQVSNKVIFAFQQTDRVFALTLNIYLLDQDADFAVLQSRVHELWAYTFGSYMKDDLRYTPSTCFANYPFPAEYRTSERLTAVGGAYERFRHQLLSVDDARERHMDGKEPEGLLSTYNRFHDPEETLPGILKLRQLHDEMDRAVLDAYGWTDIRPKCEFLLDYEIDEEEWGNKRKPYRYRWPDDVRDEVLGRLLALNAERAAAEHLAEPALSKPAPKRKKAKAVNPSLLDDGV